MENKKSNPVIRTLIRMLAKTLLNDGFEIGQTIKFEKLEEGKTKTSLIMLNGEEKSLISSTSRAERMFSILNSNSFGMKVLSDDSIELIDFQNNIKETI